MGTSDAEVSSRRTGEWTFLERLLRRHARRRPRVGRVVKLREKRARGGMIGLARQNPFQRVNRSIAMSLCGIDFGQCDGRQRRRSAGPLRHGQAAERANPVRRVRKVQPALDRVREQIARDAEPPPRLLPALRIADTPQEKFVHEFGTREDARPRDPRGLRARDESVAVETLQLQTVHPASLARASATSRPICSLSSFSPANFLSSRKRWISCKRESSAVQVPGKNRGRTSR